MDEVISSLMQRAVCSVRMDDTVAQVEAVLANQRLSWVPVLEPASGEAIGVISALDIVAFHAQGRDASAVQAWQLCTYKPVAVDVATPLSRVAQLMLERGVHHVVVTEHGKLAGVASSLDFVRTFLAASR